MYVFVFPGEVDNGSITEQSKKDSCLHETGKVFLFLYGHCIDISFSNEQHCDGGREKYWPCW